MSVNVCVCMLALITQHANKIFSVQYYIVTCGLPDSAKYSHKRHNFQKKLLNIKCVFSLQFLSETFLILGTIEREIVKDVCQSSCKVPVTLVRF